MFSTIIVSLSAATTLWQMVSCQADHETAVIVCSRAKRGWKTGNSHPEEASLSRCREIIWKETAFILCLTGTVPLKLFVLNFSNGARCVSGNSFWLKSSPNIDIWSKKATPPVVAGGYALRGGGCRPSWCGVPCHLWWGPAIATFGPYLTPKKRENSPCVNLNQKKLSETEKTCLILSGQSL